MKKCKRRAARRKPWKLSEGRGWAWRSWLKRAGALWLTTPHGRRRVSVDEAREFIGRYAGRVWIAYYPVFGHLTIERQ